MSLRAIVELPNFQSDLEMFRQNYPEIDLIYDKAKRALQDNPFEGQEIESGTNVRRYLTDPTDEMPGFLIYYLFDLDHIYLFQMKKVRFW